MGVAFSDKARNPDCNGLPDTVVLVIIVLNMPLHLYHDKQHAISKYSKKILTLFYVRTTTANMKSIWGNKTVAGWIVEGIKEDGCVFRPSDWVERLADTVASFGPDHRLRYGSVRPCMINGKKCLLVNRALEQENPEAYAFVKGFVLSNHLRINDLSSREEAA